jgi:membrane fusion protein (multidrug efflux system)
LRKFILLFPPRSSRLLLLALVVLLPCCQSRKKEKKDSTPTLQVLTVTPRSVTTYSDFPATVQGKDVVDIRPMVEGYLEKTYVPEGANVKRGELLFKLRNPVYEQAVITAKAAIKIAVANVDAAKMNVNKVKPLVDRKIVSKYELDAAEYSLQSAEASLAEANAQLANAQTNLGYTEVHSPLSGVIGGVNYKIGALINSTMSNPLTTLSNIDTVFAYFSISENELLALSQSLPGNTLQEKLTKLLPVTLLLANDSIYPFKGTVKTASGLISTQTGSASLKARFQNPHHVIRSGSSATIRIPHQTDNALIVPQAATYELQDKRFIYKLMAGNRVVSTAIVSTPTSNGKSLIVQKGLKPGDRVVITGTKLNDSTVIVPVPMKPDSLLPNAKKK